MMTNDEINKLEVQYFSSMGIGAYYDEVLKALRAAAASAPKESNDQKRAGHGLVVGLFGARPLEEWELELIKDCHPNDPDGSQYQD